MWRKKATILVPLLLAVILGGLAFADVLRARVNVENPNEHRQRFGWTLRELVDFPPGETEFKGVLMARGRIRGQGSQTASFKGRNFEAGTRYLFRVRVFDLEWRERTNRKGEKRYRLRRKKAVISSQIIGFNGFGDDQSFELTAMIPLVPDPGDLRRDRDDDGVPDHMDFCPDEPGPRWNRGCPVFQPTPPDRDNDGVPDHVDDCPDQPGPAWNHGCPVDSPVKDSWISFENDWVSRSNSDRAVVYRMNPDGSKGAPVLEVTRNLSPGERDGPHPIFSGDYVIEVDLLNGTRSGPTGVTLIPGESFTYTFQF